VLCKWIAVVFWVLKEIARLVVMVGGYDVFLVSYFFMISGRNDGVDGLTVVPSFRPINVLLLFLLEPLANDAIRVPCNSTADADVEEEEYSYDVDRGSNFDWHRWSWY
jgi:hypothetical protein